MTMRVVFMGTPDFSVAALRSLLNAGHEIVAAYSQPPRPAGRGMGERRSPVHEFAAAANIPVFTPRSLRTAEAQAEFGRHFADVAVVVAYGLILPKAILEAPRHGCLNIHASALPRWRGAAPIQRAIMAGDTETGVMIMQMDEGLDTGPVCLGERIPIGQDATAGELHDQLSELGGRLIVEALAQLEAGRLERTPQREEGTTYASKIDKAETHIDFSRPAAEVHNHIRGLSPFPGAWFETQVGGKPERIKVLRSALKGRSAGAQSPGTVIDDQLAIACGDGRSVHLVEVQRAGKKPMSAAELLRGFTLPIGTRLT
jgi:methionyl-tRNA formyltransferase